MNSAAPTPFKTFNLFFHKLLLLLYNFNAWSKFIVNGWRMFDYSYFLNFREIFKNISYVLVIYKKNFVNLL